ncbi:hypothetical protein EON65_06885 [archaeon]|nr:MAG: hypothetical protein EON65_06885 [archaeon]
MHCAQQGLLTLESAGGEGGGESSGDLAICAVNREHVWVRRHKVASLDLFKQFLQGNVEAVGGFGKGGTSGGVLAPLFVKPVKGAKYVVQDLYKVPKKLREVVGEFTGEYGETLKISEVRELLSEYIKKEALEEGAKKGEVMLKGDRHSTLLALLDGGLGVGSGASTESTGKALGSSTRIVQDECEVVEGKSKVGGDDDEGYYAEETDFSSPSWGGGLALPPTLPSVPLYTLKIREGGLIDVHSIDQEKAKKPSTAEEDGRWKPVSLPPAPPPPTQMRKTSSLATQSASSSYQASKRPTTMGNKPKSSISSAPSLPLHDVIVTKEQFVKRLLSKMTLYYLILTPQGRVHIHAGSPPMIQIIVERRQGNKTVTLVRGLEHYDVDLAEICKKCQKK